LLEIWGAEDAGCFTDLITKPNGINCVVASGQNWHEFDIMAKKGVAG